MRHRTYAPSGLHHHLSFVDKWDRRFDPESRVDDFLLAVVGSRVVALTCGTGVVVWTS